MTAADKYLERYAPALKSAREHARLVFPEESCGFIVDGLYIALTNIARPAGEHVQNDRDCPCVLCAFVVEDREYLKYAGRIQAVVHSHPNGPAFPSASDMIHQDASGLAWIILTLDESRFGPVTVWGGDCPIEPLIGREFIHGISDCYSLIKDVFDLGREALAQQEIDWPLAPISLPVAPRNDGWWELGDDLYQDNFGPAGFVEVSISDVKPGDVFLAKIRSQKLNHGGVLLNNNLILHHLPQRLSRREPAGIWARSAAKWIRYTGASK